MQTRLPLLSRTSAFYLTTVQLDCYHCAVHCYYVRISLHCSTPIQSYCSTGRVSHCIAIVLLSRHDPYCTEHSLLSFRHPKTIKYPSAPSHFYFSSQITHNNSQTTIHTQQLQTQQPQPNQFKLPARTQQEHAVQDQHVFHQKHPRRFGYRCSRQHSSWTYDHGHASPIWQSQQRPSRGRRFKLPLQIHQQHWRNGHKYGCRLHTETLFHRQRCPWWWVMPSFSHHRQPCN